MEIVRKGSGIIVRIVAVAATNGGGGIIKLI